MIWQCAGSAKSPWVQGGEDEEDRDRQLPGSLPAELPNGRVPRLESSKGWGRLDLPSKAKPKPHKPVAVHSNALNIHFTSTHNPIQSLPCIAHSAHMSCGKDSCPCVVPGHLVCAKHRRRSNNSKQALPTLC